MTHTIYAPATAAGRAAVAVVRVSGPEAGDVVRRLAGRRPRPRMASLRSLRDARGEIIDQALVLWLPGPGSYTGEDCAEFHVHGGRGVTAALLEALGGMGLRMAEPGEFTRRAFQNGRLDLAQAEAVADVIDAETAAQRRQALAQLGGRLSDAHARWRGMLTEALAVLEAAVDFPDEDLPEDVAARAGPVLQALLAEVQAAQADAWRGERVREGYRIAIIGEPNAGKSTLLNALAGRDAAIVTDVAGTTRDIIEAPLELGGYQVLLADTAGLRATVDAIEAEGVRRARAWAGSADRRLWVVDGSTEAVSPPRDLMRAGDLLVLNKSDRPQGPAWSDARSAAAAAGMFHVELAATQPGQTAGLRARLTDDVVEALSGQAPPMATRERHRRDLAAAGEALQSALLAGGEAELAAEDVRLAARALDRITGRIETETVLDHIFASFCIGK